MLDLKFASLVTLFQRYVFTKLEVSAAFLFPENRRQSGRLSSSKENPTLMMQQLGWNTLEVRRNQARAVMMYRTVNGMIAIPASLYLTPNTRNTRRHGCKFRVPAGCVDAFNYSFFPTTIRIWNQLPNDIVLSPSIEAFKSRLTGTSATQTSINILLLSARSITFLSA